MWGAAQKHHSGASFSRIPSSADDPSTHPLHPLHPLAPLHPLTPGPSAFGRDREGPRRAGGGAPPAGCGQGRDRHLPHDRAHFRWGVLDRPADLLVTGDDAGDAAGAGAVARRELAGKRHVHGLLEGVFRLVRGGQRVDVQGRRRVARGAAAAVAAGSPTSRAAARAAKARERRCPVRFPSRAKARMPSMASRGRVSHGAFASNSGSTRSAQSAAQSPSCRRSSSLMVTLFTRTSCRFRRALSPGLRTAASCAAGQLSRVRPYQSRESATPGRTKK